MNRLIRIIAAAPEKKHYRRLFQILFGRRFQMDTSRRLLILFEPNRISYASVFPFLEYAQEFRSRYDVEIRFLPVKEAIERGVPEGLKSATSVFAQTWLTDPMTRHEQLEQILKALPESVTKGYLDSFANNDIRLAGIFSSASLYYKKSLFKDLSEFTRRTYGHTNLTEYYGRLYGLTDEPTDWNVPHSVLPNLRLAPNFLTDPDLSAWLSAELTTTSSQRSIDLHARLGGTKADGWYGEMRRHAATVVDQLTGFRVAKGVGVSSRQFREELTSSKACFSPFGYGELCWRDIESIAAGAVLIKPDMSHLRTEPDLYRDGETYVACRWDFADLEERLTDILDKEERRLYLTENARRVARDYLASSGPVTAYADIFRDRM